MPESHYSDAALESKLSATGSGNGASSWSPSLSASALKLCLSTAKLNRGTFAVGFHEDSSLDGRIPIFIEPGMAFGTGTHETTQLCLEALEQYLPARGTCLDVGTGSGILAIAAVKLGSRKVVGCDIDPIAVEIAARNSSQNACGTKARWVLGDLESTRPFQPGCLVANLTVELIEEEFRKLEQRVKHGACLILSGLLNGQVRRIENLRRKSSLRLRRRLTKGEWSCLVYVRP